MAGLVPATFARSAEALVAGTSPAMTDRARQWVKAKAGYAGIRYGSVAEGLKRSGYGPVGPILYAHRGHTAMG